MAASPSTIRFSLTANRLTGSDENPYKAVVRSYKTIGNEEMIADLAAMNASVSRQEILVVLDLMKAVIRKYLLAGFNVNTDLFNARVTVTGGFSSEEEEYDPARHAARVRMVPAADLKKGVARDARFEKTRADEPAPKPDSVYDFATLSRNATVSPGHVAEVKGLYLDCDSADETQGVFFVDKTNAARKADVVHKSSGTSVLFRVPRLAPGAYSLIVRRGFGKEVREGRLKAEISVN